MQHILWQKAYTGVRMMGIGPCLCGDPYCPSCGNLGAAAFESAIDDLVDAIDKKQLDEFELNLFISVGFAAIDAHRKALKDMKDNAEAYP